MSDVSREQEIRERLDATRSGPWSWRVSRDRVWALVERPSLPFESPVAQCGDDDDAAFIAHAREDIPYLLEENERLRRYIDSIIEGTEP